MGVGFDGDGDGDGDGDSYDDGLSDGDGSHLPWDFLQSLMLECQSWST